MQALIHTADSLNNNSRLLEAVEDVNNRQKEVLFNKINKYFNGNLLGKTIAIWGLSFKPNTDDMREAPSRVLMEALWNAGAKIQAFDPEAMEETNRIYSQRENLILCKDKETALENADALAICTEWKYFRAPDFGDIKNMLKQPVIFDGRNMFEPEIIKNYGLEYFSIGR